MSGERPLATPLPTLPGPSPADHASRVAIALTTILLTTLLMAAALVLTLGVVGEPLTAELVAFPVGYVTFGAVGALVVGRRSGNRVAWLSLLTGLLGAIAAIADSYARVAAPSPGQDWAAWLASVAFPASLGPMLLVFLVFPTGALGGRGRRLVAFVTVTGVAMLCIGNAFSPVFADHPARPNPLAIAAFAGSPLEQGGVGWLLVLFGAMAAAVGLVLRLRAARGRERLQLAWVTFAVAIHGTAWLFLAVQPPELGGLAQTLVFATLALVPIATGIAILRHRLYDIEVVVRRTVLYGLVTAILGAIYAVSMLASQALLSQAIGGGSLAVALSTLLVALLFSPIRRRIGAGLDRRFFRSGDDSDVVLAEVRERLRDEVDLTTVIEAVEGAAMRTVRPAGCSIWLR